MLHEATAADVPLVNAILGIDATEYMGRVITLLNDHGGFFLEPITSSVFEAHMFFAKEGRGKDAISAARAGLRFMFWEKQALVIFGRIPAEDRPARLMTRMIGFRSEGVKPREPGGPLVEWFEMRCDECPQQQQ